MRTNIVTTWLFGAVNGHGAFYIKETNKEDSVRLLDPLIYGLQHEYWSCRTKKRKLNSKIAFQFTGKIPLIDCSEQLGDYYVCPHGEGVVCLNLLHQKRFK